MTGDFWFGFYCGAVMIGFPVAILAFGLWREVIYRGNRLKRLEPISTAEYYAGKGQ